MLEKLVVILGPTATGKTDLSIKLAKKFNGEIVSVDSRQVYKGMDIGTGKVTKEEMQGIPHYLLDVVSPKSYFTVARYQKLSQKAIDKILKTTTHPPHPRCLPKAGGWWGGRSPARPLGERAPKKIPFLVGGSPFYIYSIVEGWQFPKLKPDWKLRKNLEKKSTPELFKILKKLDKERAKNIDKFNKRRLVRAIEIAKKLGKVPKIKKNPQYNCLLIGIKKEPEILEKLIEKRLLNRFRQGMIKEVKTLHKNNVSWKRLEEFGLEYKWLARFLQKKINYEEMLERLKKDIEHFAKRQMTWFKKNKRIKWIKNYREAEKLIKGFLKNP